MNLSALSKRSNNTNNTHHCRNYTSLDIKEKIKILHKINSNNFINSFEIKEKEIKDKNEKLLNSTLPSFVLKRNNIYQKKLIKNYSSKNSPNIYVVKNSNNKEKKHKNFNKEDIINEIKSNSFLKQSIKKELKNEIINEFLEDLVNIDDKKVIDFLKIKNLILSSEKFKSNVDQKILTRDNSNQDYVNSNTNTNTNLSLNDIYSTEKKNINNNKKNRFIFNLDEIQMKNNIDNKRFISSTPVKTIFNNLFINNNEKYIIKKPYQGYSHKYLNNIRKNSQDIRLSKFNFQIVNDCKNNNIINNESFSDFVSKSNLSFYEDDMNIEKINLDTKTKMDDSTDNEKDICNYKNDENDTIIHCINSINREEKIQNDKKYIRNSLEKDNLITDTNYNDKKEEKNMEEIKITISVKNEKNEKKIFDKNIKKKENNNKNTLKHNTIRKSDIKIEDEKRKELIKKIIEDSKKAIRNKNFFNNKYISLFVLKKNNRRRQVKEEILNKSFMFRNHKNIKLNPTERNIFNSFSEHKGRNRNTTFSNFLHEEKSNIFRISHIKKYLKVLQKDNNKHLLNTKWLKNISKKNIPLLCFDKK